MNRPPPLYGLPMSRHVRRGSLESQTDRGNLFPCSVGTTERTRRSVQSQDRGAVPERLREDKERPERSGVLTRRKWLRSLVLHR